MFIFTSGSSALLGRPRCGLSIWLSLLAIFNTLFWVYVHFSFHEKTDKTRKYSEVHHFRMLGVQSINTERASLSWWSAVFALTLETSAVIRFSRRLVNTDQLQLINPVFNLSVDAELISTDYSCSVCDRLRLISHIEVYSAHPHMDSLSPSVCDWITTLWRLVSVPLYLQERDGYLKAIWSHLSGKQISWACNVAQQNGDYRLSLLLPQVTGSTMSRRLLQEQLNDWEKLKVRPTDKQTGRQTSRQTSRETSRQGGRQAGRHH